jgi:hypothetical protein
MSGSVLLLRQLSLKIFNNNSSLGIRFATRSWDTAVSNRISRKRSLASLCEHPNAAWLTKLFVGRTVSRNREARQVFLAAKTIQDLCFAGVLISNVDEVRRAAERGDAFAQASMAERTGLPWRSVFDGRKNLLFKVNAKVFTNSVFATEVDLDA